MLSKEGRAASAERVAKGERGDHDVVELADDRHEVRDEEAMEVATLGADVVNLAHRRRPARTA